MNAKALSWILSNKTGIPSKTIWYVMMNVTAPAAEDGFHFDVPYDRADFSHCYNLLVKVPEWRARLQEVADVFPAWQPFVDNWNELSSLYEEEKECHTAPKLYNLIQSCWDQPIPRLEETE